MAPLVHVEHSTDADHKLVADERMYTGEPVETDEGLRRPQQMAVGKDNVEGGGEFPGSEDAAAHSSTTRGRGRRSRLTGRPSRRVLRHIRCRFGCT